MLEPRMSPSTRACLERIQVLPINVADRERARAEFERAEASAETVLGIVARFRHAVTVFRWMFAVHRQPSNNLLNVDSARASILAEAPPLTEGTVKPIPPW